MCPRCSVTRNGTGLEQLKTERVVYRPAELSLLVFLSINNTTNVVLLDHFEHRASVLGTKEALKHNRR